MKIGIIGASGYTGSELLRILSVHQKAEVVAASSRRYEGIEIWRVHKFLKGFFDLNFCSPDLNNFSECDIVFTAVPHGKAMDYVPELLDLGIRVIDLSADYRLEKKLYEKVYGLKHKGYRHAAYGLPELNRENISNSILVANPGCYPTGTILAVAPLANAELIDRVVFDCKSGITGAGERATPFTHYPNLHESIVPYKITQHRHYYEIVQELNKLQNGVRVSFTPQVFPGSRGILTTSHVFLRGNLDYDEIRKIYDKFYKDSPFVRVQEQVSLAQVRGSNFCDISIHVGDDRVVVISAIDNLVKGASGQAVQNMNIMIGIDEREGLWYPPLFP